MSSDAMIAVPSHPTIVDPWELHFILMVLKDWELSGDHHIHKSLRFRSCQQALQWHAVAQSLVDPRGRYCLFYLGNIGSGRIEIDILRPNHGHLARADLDIAINLNKAEKEIKRYSSIP